jgi:hypothetical protein
MPQMRKETPLHYFLNGPSEYDDKNRTISHLNNQSIPECYAK